jgi:hypothetical protein
MAEIVLNESDLAIAAHARQKFDWATDDLAAEYRDRVTPEEWDALCAGWRVILERLIRTTAAVRAMARFLEPTADKPRSALVRDIWQEHTGEWEGYSPAMEDADRRFARISERFEVGHTSPLWDAQYGLQLAAEAYLLNPESDWDIAELVAR